VKSLKIYELAKNKQYFLVKKEKISCIMENETV